MKQKVISILWTSVNDFLESRDTQSDQFNKLIFAIDTMEIQVLFIISAYCLRK